MKEKVAFTTGDDVEELGTNENGRPARKTIRTREVGHLTLRIALSVAMFLVATIFAFAVGQPIVLVLGTVAAVVLFFSTHVVMEWERAVILRNGKFRRVCPPGLMFTVPFIDSCVALVDMRIRTTTIKAEKTLSADLVPMDVDAVLYWVVWDAKNACLEVRDVEDAVYFIAQTTLRDVIGSIDVSQMGTRRRQIDKEILETISKKTVDWGVNVTMVEIRDISIPDDLQEAMSAEARAEREYKARVLLAEVEEQVADMYVEAVRKYGQEEDALRLRAMSLLSGSVAEKGGFYVVPSSFADAFEGFGSNRGK